MRPEEGNKAGERPERNTTWGAAEDFVLVYSREKEAPIALHSFPKRRDGKGGADLFFLVSCNTVCRDVSDLHQKYLDWTLGSIYFPRGWSDTAVGFPEKWLMSQSCHCSRGIWTLPLRIWFNFGRPWTGLYNHCGPLPAAIVYCLSHCPLWWAFPRTITGVVCVRNIWGSLCVLHKMKLKNELSLSFEAAVLTLLVLILSQGWETENMQI